MNIKVKKRVFNVAGGIVVGLWILMTALFIQDNRSKRIRQDLDIHGNTSRIASTQLDWMDVFLKGKKVGYAMNKVSPSEEGYRIREEISLRLNLMNLPSDIRAVTHCLVDPKFLLRRFSFSMNSGMASFDLSGRVDGDWLLVKRDEGKRVERLRLSGPLYIGASLAQFFKGRRIEVGQSFKFRLFDPSTLSQRPAVFTVSGVEDLKINRHEYTAYRLDSELLGQTVHFWLDESGYVLKEEGFMGLTLVRSSAAEAPRGITKGGGSDFYQMAAIAVRNPVERPRSLSYLKLKAEGLAGVCLDEAILNGGRQRFRDPVLEITREGVPAALHYDPHPAYPKEVRAYLEPEFNVESEDETIRRSAREISGEMRDPVRLACKMTNWVYRHVDKRPVVSVPSAIEVLQTRVGDCNEHAVLLTALLRAAGIPSRPCVGLVYDRGKFFYHAWTEAYLGEWVSMDSTLNQMPVDASHVKLAQGGLDQQVEIIRLIGRLKLEVLDYMNDSTD
jgi:transglutaminase-like putative cysteine protease